MEGTGESVVEVAERLSQSMGVTIPDLARVYMWWGPTADRGTCAESARGVAGGEVAKSIVAIDPAVA